MEVRTRCKVCGVYGFPRLCPGCLSILKDVDYNPILLRRLIAYASHDHGKMSVYLAGSLRNKRIPEIAQVLRSHGFDAIDEWHAVGPEADDHWQKYEQNRKRPYREALKGRAAQNVFLFDRAYIDISDALVMVMPCGKSAHLELGYAVGAGKPAFILNESKTIERYEVMPNFADALFESLDELVERLLELRQSNGDKNA